MPAWSAPLVAYVVSAIPFSFLVARAATGVDLREHGTGTVSGTGLYEVAGFGPLVVGGLLDVAKGAAGPALALARGQPALAAVAAGLAVAAHNWSPFLRGAGGRGISPALGALAVVSWPGSVVLLAGLAFGKLAGATGLGSFIAQAALVPILAVVSGPTGALAGGLVLAALWGKRVVGNGPPDRPSPRAYASRLLFDRDEAVAGRRGGEAA